MVQLPIDFESSAQSTSGTRSSWSVSSGAFHAECAVPAEFGGNGAGFSPEDFFAQALMNCFVGTFKVYSEASKVSFSDLTVRAKLTVDKNEQGQTVMSRCHLSIWIKGVAQPDRVQTLVTKTSRSRSRRPHFDLSFGGNGLVLSVYFEFDLFCLIFQLTADREFKRLFPFRHILHFIGIAIFFKDQFLGFALA